MWAFCFQFYDPVFNGNFMELCWITDYLNEDCQCSWFCKLEDIEQIVLSVVLLSNMDEELHIALRTAVDAKRVDILKGKMKTSELFRPSNVSKP